MAAGHNLHPERRDDKWVAQIVDSARRGLLAILEAEVRDWHELPRRSVEQHHVAASRAGRSAESHEQHAGR